MKALVGAFNQEKALVGAFSAMVQLRQLIVCNTTRDTPTAEEGPALPNDAMCAGVFCTIHRTCAGVSVIVIAHGSLARALPSLENNKHAH